MPLERPSLIARRVPTPSSYRYQYSGHATTDARLDSPLSPISPTEPLRRFSQQAREDEKVASGHSSAGNGSDGTTTNFGTSVASVQSSSSPMSTTSVTTTNGTYDTTATIAAAGVPSPSSSSSTSTTILPKPRSPKYKESWRGPNGRCCARRAWRLATRITVGVLLVAAFIWEQFYKTDREAESDWPFMLSAIAFTPLLFDLLEDVSLCFRTPTTKEERDVIWRRKFRPKKELHLLSVQVLLGSISIMLVLAWFQHIRDIDSFDKYPSTISFLVADLRTSYGVCFFLAVPFAGHVLYRSHWLTSRYGRKFEGTICAAMQGVGMIPTYRNPTTWQQIWRARLHTFAAIPAMMLLPMLVLFRDEEIKKNHKHVRYMAIGNIVVCCLFQHGQNSKWHPLFTFVMETLAAVGTALLIYIIPNPRRCYGDRGHGHEITEQSIAANLPLTKRFHGMPTALPAVPQHQAYGHDHPYNVSLTGSLSGPPTTTTPNGNHGHGHGHMNGNGNGNGYSNGYGTINNGGPGGISKYD